MELKPCDTIFSTWRQFIYDVCMIQVQAATLFLPWCRRSSGECRHLEVEVQSLLSEVHGLQQLLVLAGSVNALLLHHSAHVFHVLVPDGLEPVQRVELQVLVQQLQDVRYT